MAQYPNSDTSLLSVPEQIGFATVRIECSKADGKSATGTGFYFAFRDAKGEPVPVIVTNNHVVSNAEKGIFFVTFRTPTGQPDFGKFHRFEVTDFGKRWAPHPDPSVDLCVMPLAPLFREAQVSGMHFYFVTLEEGHLPTSEDVSDMIGMEQITMVGYPIGLWDEKNNAPIFRRGILASHYRFDWNGKSQFLIDAACYPGSSGSPILLLDTAGYESRKGAMVGPGKQRIKLLGVLFGGPQFSAQGEIKIVTVPVAQVPVAVTSIPSNLGVAIKAEQLRAFRRVLGL